MENTSDYEDITFFREKEQIYKRDGANKVEEIVIKSFLS